MTVRFRKDCQHWMVDISLPSRPRLRKIIPEARNKAQALHLERTLINELFEGRYAFQPAPSFASFVETVYLPWAQMNKRSWRSDVGHCKVLTRFFGQQPLDQITPSDIKRFKLKRQGGNERQEEAGQPGFGQSGIGSAEPDFLIGTARRTAQPQSLPVGAEVEDAAQTLPYTLSRRRKTPLVRAGRTSGVAL